MTISGVPLLLTLTRDASLIVHSRMTVARGLAQSDEVGAMVLSRHGPIAAVLGRLFEAATLGGDEV